MLSLSELQKQQKEWADRNFPTRKNYQPLLGVIEEVGELAHAHLKQEQGIRGTKEEFEYKKKDAVGDVIVFLADYCTLNNLDLQQCLEDAWAEVKQRDWRKNETKNVQ